MNTSLAADLVPLIVVAFMVGLIPFVAMMVTSYTKIVVVLGLLRQALGVQQVPPNMVLNGLAIILSTYIMAPIAMDTMDTVQGAKKQGPTPSSLEQLAHRPVPGQARTRAGEGLLSEVRCGRLAARTRSTA
jgi:type III secretion protein R